ncbi:MAG TPA: hypothetical protein VE570_01395, partial [Thermoleophilaceae bacterium]|nr:hypothetical protein [Thermoleophilaceae bacterium]
MNKHLAIITAVLTLVVPAASAQASNVKSKVRFGATAYAVAEDAGNATLSVTRTARNGKSKPANLNNTVSV